MTEQYDDIHKAVQFCEPVSVLVAPSESYRAADIFVSLLKCVYVGGGEFINNATIIY